VVRRRLVTTARQSAEAELTAGPVGRRRRSFVELLVIAAGFVLAMLGAVYVMQQQSGTVAATTQSPVAALNRPLSRARARFVRGPSLK
jgi:hypothetical protein